MERELTEKRIKMLKLTCDLKDGDKVRHFYKGHEYVEIGGIKWAVMNVGAEKVTDSGLYFQWGDSKGYTKEEIENGDKSFTFKDYKYYDCDKHAITKYNNLDKKLTLESIDDAVMANWGEGWRMPTTYEFQALGNAVDTEWTTDYQGSGVKGIVLTDKKDKSKKLFFPIGGWSYESNIYGLLYAALYWSSSRYKIDCYFGHSVNFYHTMFNQWDANAPRYMGKLVRGIVEY